MNKIKLTIALVFGFTIANAQDTTCTFFADEHVVEFNYYTDKIIHQEKQTTKFYDIEVLYGNVLCLYLCDQHKYKKVRKVIITYFDGSTHEQVLNSYDDIYYSPRGAVKVSVSKPKLMIKL